MRECVKAKHCLSFSVKAAANTEAPAAEQALCISERFEMQARNLFKEKKECQKKENKKTRGQQTLYLFSFFVHGIRTFMIRGMLDGAMRYFLGLEFRIPWVQI